MTERSDIHKSTFVNRHSSIPALPGWVPIKPKWIWNQKELTPSYNNNNDVKKQGYNSKYSTEIGYNRACKIPFKFT